MKYRLQCQPTYSAVEVDLEPGERVVAESGAMAWMSSNITTETAARGGMLAGLKRKLLSGESFFQNTYCAEGSPGQVAFAPGSPGHIVAHSLAGGELYLEKGAYLASTEGIACDTKFDGLKGFFNEGLFVLRVTGQGTLFFNGYGDIQEVEVDGQYTVDNGYAVAWEPSLQYELSRGRKIRSFLFSDQLLLRFSGRGRVWVQSRSPQSLASWAHPFRPTDSRRSGGGGKILIALVLLMVLFCGCCGCGGILMALMGLGGEGQGGGPAEFSRPSEENEFQFEAPEAPDSAAREATAPRSFADALKQLERLGSGGGNSPSALNERSWEVVQSPYGDPEAYAQALADALKAVRGSREDRNIVNTYGVALYRVGAYEAARLTFERNLQRWDDPLGGQSVYDRVFLAMAYSQLGDQENAAEALHIVLQTIEREGLAEEAAAMVRPSELLRFVAEAQYTVGSAAGFESH